MNARPRPRRGEAGYAAFVVHRVSGVALALFLPVHLWVLGLGIERAARLDAFLAWTERPSVRAAEVALVVLLAAHLAGGLRVLLVELTPWRGWYARLVPAAAALTVALGLAFALNLAA